MLGGERVWNVFSLGEGGVVFQTFSRLLTVRGGQLADVEEAPEGRRFHKAFEAAGQVFVRLEGAGLLTYDGDQLRLPADGGRFADVPVRALFDLDGETGGDVLVFTDAEAFLFDPSGRRPTRPLETAATDVLEFTRAYHGCALSDTGGVGPLFALTTLGGGVLIVDASGAVLDRLDQSVGLTPNDLVLGCGTDAQGGLWLALSDGVLRVDAASPLSVFDARLGLTGAVYGLSRHEYALYASTEQGVFRVRPGVDGNPVAVEQVRPSGGEMEQVWRSYTTLQGLLVAATGGVFEVRGGEARQVTGEAGFSLASLGGDSPSTPERVLVGLRDGIAVLEQKGEEWSEAGRVGGVAGEVRTFAEAPGRTSAWALGQDGRLHLISGDALLVGTYGLEDGVPPELAGTWYYGTDLLGMTPEGVYHIRLDEATGSVRAVLARDVTDLVRLAVEDLSEGYGISTDATGRLWVTGRDRVRAFARDGDGWADVTPATLRDRAGVQSVLAEDGVLWVGTADGLLRLVEGADGRYAVAVPALVRGVAADGGAVAVRGGQVTVPYQADVRFRFSAASYNDPEGTRFRTQLVGFDDAPSPWSNERFRDYTNLPPGDYTFRVEARTSLGAPARPAAVAVAVPPPWYLTRWAAALWAALAGLVLGTVAWGASARQRRLARAERDRADELARLNDALRQADRLKDNMLANTSHELRTPLVAVLGFAEILAEYDGGDPAEVR